ncbi:MAG TPA: glycosyltransferase family 4 protein, partial [Puia sp.]|nr:glycosyltransferase family 4 protein [Puia sp.]
YPPMSGGAQRCMNILDQLSRRFDTTIIIHQDEDSLMEARREYPGLQRSRFIYTKDAPKPRDIFSLAPVRIQNALRYRYWNRSLKGSAGGDYLKIYPVLKALFKKQRFDYYVLEDISVIRLAGLIRRYFHKARIIYDAYNINSKLAMPQNGGVEKESFLDLRFTESHLSDFVTDVFTCSAQDLEELTLLNQHKISGAVIPNGVKPDDDQAIIPGGSMEDNQILYCGSLDYQPNQEGMIWFCEKVMPLILTLNPSATLMVVGKGDPGKRLTELFKGPGIRFIGMVDDTTPYYRKAVLAIVPLNTGSGTRLKLLEAMGRRKAVVATSVGAEGIKYQNGKNILIADDPASFASAVNRLLKDRSLVESIASSAHTLVRENYDWNIVGSKMEAYLNN